MEFRSLYSVLANINVPGLDIQFVKNTGAQKTSEGLLIHSQWPVEFYNALDRSKQLKMRNLEYMQCPA